MLNGHRDKKLATAMVGSFPKPAWFTESLHGRPFKIAMGDSLYREQYVDAVACYVNEQERAGLDILTDGDTRFDLEVGGRSVVLLHHRTARRNLGLSTTPSHFLGIRRHQAWPYPFEVQEAYHPPAVTGKITRGPLHYSALWKTAQRMTASR